MIFIQRRRRPRAESQQRVPKFKGGTSIRSRILVVDDDRKLAESLAELLRLHGYDVQVAFCGQSAIEMAPRFEPEIVISDVVMPDMNGVELAGQIRALVPFCRVILITGRSSAADLMLKTHALSDGFELLSKPIHPADLLRRL